MNRAASAALLLALVVSPVLFAGAELPISTVTQERAAFHQRGPRIASDGTNFLAVWHDERLPSTAVPYVTRLGADGRALDAAPIRLPLPQSDASGHGLVTWTGSVYLVFWTDWDRRTLQWVRIDRDGRVLDARPYEIAGITTPHDVVSVDGRTLLVYTSEWPESRLYGQLIEADGTAAGARITFPRAGRSDWIPRVATNGDGFYVVWNRLFGRGVDIVGIPVTLGGTLGTERTLGTGGDLFLASNGAHYLVAYQANDGSIITHQLDAAGATLERTVHAATGIGQGVTLAPYGGGYVLVTREAGNAEGRVLDGAGRETGRLPLDASSTFYMSMDIASNATTTLAVWHEELEHLASGADIFAERVDAQRDRVLLSRSAARQTNLRIATNGTGFLGAWIEKRTRSELRVGRVSASGVPLDGEGIVVAEGVTDPAALTYDGANYVLAWNEENTSGGCSVRITRITHEGVVLDRDRVVAPDCAAAAIGLGSNGRESLLVLTVSQLDPATNRFVSKLFANRVERDLSISTVVELPTQRRIHDIAVGALADLWLVAWTRREDDCGMCNPPMPPTYDIDAVRLSSGMALLDAAPLTIAETMSDRAPSIAAKANELLIAWERLSDGTIRARRVPRFGVPLDELFVTTGRAPSVVARGGDFVIGFEDDGDLFTTILGAPGRALLAASADREHAVQLAATAEGLTAAYLRVASEPLYNFVDRGFVRMLDATPRRRAIRRR